MKQKVVICEHCLSITIINITNYKKHLFAVHKVSLPENEDLSNKIVTAIEIQQRKEEQKILWQSLEEDRLKKEFELKVQNQLEFERQKQKHIEDNTKYYIVIWDDIIFEKNKIKFDIKRLKAILTPVNSPGILECLNLIKDEYFQRLYGKKFYKLGFYNSEILIEKSPDWKLITDTIEFAKEFYEYKYVNFKFKGKTKLFSHLSNPEIIKLFDSSFSKNDYLKFLATRHSNEYKIIPVMEYSNHHIEESFLFRLLTKKQTTLIIWENVQDSRATHVFASPQCNHTEILELVEEFICREDFSTKRSILYNTDSEAKKLKKELNYFKSIKHTSLIEYKAEFDKILRNI